MKKILVLFILLNPQIIFAQREDRYINSNLKMKIERLKQAGEVFHPVKLFQLVGEKSIKGVGTYYELTLDENALRDFYDSKYYCVNMLLPKPGGGNFELFLSQNKIFSDDFDATYTNETGRHKLIYEGGIHYNGIINIENKISLACISFYKNEVMGIISDETGNWSLGKSKKGTSMEYILYNDKDFNLPVKYECGVNDFVDNKYKKNLNNSKSIQKCIKIFIDCAYSFYTYQGNTSAVMNYISNLINNASTIYGNEDISFLISSINIWTSQDPFDHNTYSAALTSFENYYNSFNGNIANLIAYDCHYISAASDIPQFCPGYAYLDLCGFGTFDNEDILPVPTLALDAGLFTHENGHLFGSPHTHACVWNGNNTAIDGCGPYYGGFPYEGNCSGAPIPSSGGTIMSYCHLGSVGVNFIYGFGPQPGDLIRNCINSEGCLSSCIGNCPPFMSIGSSITNSGIFEFEAQNYIYGDNYIGQTSVTFHGGNGVILNPGFHASNGSNFHAYVGGCGAKSNNNDSINHLVIQHSNKNISQSVKNNKIIIVNDINQETFILKVPFNTSYSINILNVNKIILKTYDNCTGNSYYLDLSDLPKGDYTVKVISEGKSYETELSK